MVKTTIEEEMFEFAFRGAIGDTVVRGAYAGPRTWLFRRENLKGVKTKLKGFVDDTLSGKFKDQKDFDEKFSEMIDEIINSINGEKEAENPDFSFGNAQKLINMTFKNLYLSTYKNPEKREAFKWCHCPMDSQLLDIVWKNRKDLKCRSKIEDSKTAFRSPWGYKNTNNEQQKERYFIFQEAVRELIGKETLANSIEYDYYSWNLGNANNEEEQR